MKLVKKKNKVSKFKTRNEAFVDWFKNIVEINKLNNPETGVKSCVILYETENEQGEPCLTKAWYNMDMVNWCWYKRHLDDLILDKKFDDFLKKHVGEYLTYIN